MTRGEHLPPPSEPFPALDAALHDGDTDAKHRVLEAARRAERLRAIRYYIRWTTVAAIALGVYVFLITR